MKHDAGYSFGIGAFETMFVSNGRCVLMEKHLERLNKALDQLMIDNRPSKGWIQSLVSNGKLDGRILKIEVSDENIIATDRPFQYTVEDYERGFRLCTSEVRRNETSMFTFIKSLQYGDNIFEKRKAVSRGYDEPLFLNSEGMICEGSTTNIFFTDGEVIVTPDVNCGLLPGTIREYIIDRYDVEVTKIRLDDVTAFSECFVTNSVLGVMGVTSLDGYQFRNRSITNKIFKQYRFDVKNGL